MEFNFFKKILSFLFHTACIPEFSSIYPLISFILPPIFTPYVRYLIYCNLVRVKFIFADMSHAKSKTCIYVLCIYSDVKILLFRESRNWEGMTHTWKSMNENFDISLYILQKASPLITYIYLSFLTLTIHV